MKLNFNFFFFFLIYSTPISTPVPQDVNNPYQYQNAPTNNAYPPLPPLMSGPQESSTSPSRRNHDQKLVSSSLFIIIYIYVHICICTYTLFVCLFIVYLLVISILVSLQARVARTCSNLLYVHIYIEFKATGKQQQYSAS